MQDLVIKEFSRFAHSYDGHNLIQKEVAETLVSLLPHKPLGTIIDLGCGSGAIYENIKKRDISFTKFIALDASSSMLSIHKDSSKIEKLCANFNKSETFGLLPSADEQTLISSSALQWSEDLDFTLSHLQEKASSAYFAIFTANTFKTLHKSASLTSPIYSIKELKQSINKYYCAEFELKVYKLYFTSTQEMFKYIKMSGVNGGEKQLSYKETKNLMRTYPLDYLEFEVLFVKAKPLQI